MRQGGAGAYMRDDGDERQRGRRHGSELVG